MDETEMKLIVVMLNEVEIELLKCVFSEPADKLFEFSPQDIEIKERCQKTMDGLLKKIGYDIE